EEIRETKSPKKSNETVIKATRPQGRYKRKEREKRAYAYSAKDLEGILVKKVDESPVPKAVCSQDEDLEELVKASDDTETEVQYEKEIPPDWWATSGKQGLGIKDHPRKVAGVHFQGKKTSFSDSDREESESEDDHSSAKRKFDNISESEKGNAPKVKLKKLCRKLLRQVPEKSLKLKQLKVLVEEHSSVLSNFSSKKDALAFLRKKLEGSKKFRVEEIVAGENEFEMKNDGV
nr:hypothetical protein [Tanacetum cinerariifolium]